MLSPEERAEISRRNGAQSNGPVTPGGKAKSARNAITNGTRAQKLAHLVPPHSAVLCNESRQDFYQLFDELVERYRPSDNISLSIVREIANANWQVQRNGAIQTSIWNQELLRQAGDNKVHTPELFEVECTVAAGLKLCLGSGAIPDFTREIDRLLARTARLERRLYFLESRFPSKGLCTANTNEDRDIFLAPVDTPVDSENTVNADAEPDPESIERTCPEPGDLIENTQVSIPEVTISMASEPALATEIRTEGAHCAQPSGTPPNVASETPPKPAG